MRHGKLCGSPTPFRDILEIVTGAGILLGVGLVVLWVVLCWPVQFLMGYLGLVAVTGIAAAVEAWDEHRGCRVPQQFRVPATQNSADHPGGPDTDQPDAGQDGQW